MTEVAPPPKSLKYKATLLGKRTVAFLKVSPVTALIVYTALSLNFKENYPFSNYPMYSNPSAERPYYMITDGEGSPLAVQTLTGITCPKIGKIFRTKSEQIAKKLNTKAKELPPEGVQTVCMEIFAQLREGAATRQQVLPERLQLRKSHISYQNGQVVEDLQVIGTETLSQDKP